MATRNGKRAKAKPKSPDITPGSLVVPAHGGGMIRHGSLPGNTPGTGRPPSVLRERLRGSFAERVSTLEQIADGTAIQKVKLPNGQDTDTLVSADVPDRLKAIDLMAKYGLGTQKEVTVEDVRDRLIRTLAIIREEFGDQPEKLTRTLSRLRPVWA